MYKDFFSVNGVPQSLVVSLSVLLFLISIAPLFSGSRVFGIDFPELTRLGRRIAVAIGSLGLFLLVMGFQPRWLDRNEQAERLPFCSLQNENPSATHQNIRWFTDSAYPAWSVVKVDDVVVSREAIGSYELLEDNDDSRSVIEVAAGNRYGTCQKRILAVWHPAVAANSPVECSLAIDQGRASIGDTYELSWQVSGPEGTAAFINGSRVSLTDSANFTFSGPNYDRFLLIANFSGVECEAQAWIEAE